MIRVNIVETKYRVNNVLKTLHFEDEEIDSAKRWARDMVNYMAGAGHECISTLYQCQGKDTPSLEQLGL